MIYKIPSPAATDAGNVSVRCPACRQQGTFEPIGGIRDAAHGDMRFGQRRCPNPACRAQLFVCIDQNYRVVVSYPAERIDFDSTDIPASVMAALEEAITCHANRCFVASAIMVRKCLEELCTERGATGGNLKERLKSLGNKVLLPNELINGLDDLRLLGNDAAHIESQAYQKVGQEEVEVGIMFTKEVLKAVYQYKTLLAKLQALKKTP